MTRARPWVSHTPAITPPERAVLTQGQSRCRPFTAPGTRRIRLALAIVGGVLALSVAAVLLFAASLGRAYDTKRHVVADASPAAEDRPAAATGRAAQAVNVLLLGTDVDSADPESPQEADTVMLLQIPAYRSKVYAVSILRNSYVAVPGHGRQAINSAYAFGGVKLEVQTVEQLLGVRIDHVVDVSLNGLQGLTDALGGVEVHTPAAFSNDGVDFPADTHVLNGVEALAYLRAGDFRATGDAVRATAQEQYFKGVLRQELSAKLLLDPAALAASVNVFLPYLTTDRGLDSATLAALGASLRDLRSSELTTVRVASTGVSQVDSATVVNLDSNAVRIMSELLRGDRMFAYSS